jgi:hypothetical protein
LCLQGLPSGASNLWVLMFHGGIASMLGLYLLFWTKLNLAQTVTPFLVLGLFTAGVCLVGGGLDGRLGGEYRGEVCGHGCGVALVLGCGTCQFEGVRYHVTK